LSCSTFLRSGTVETVRDMEGAEPSVFAAVPSFALGQLKQSLHEEGRSHVYGCSTFLRSGTVETHNDLRKDRSHSGAAVPSFALGQLKLCRTSRGTGSGCPAAVPSFALGQLKPHSCSGVFNWGSAAVPSFALGQLKHGRCIGSRYIKQRCSTFLRSGTVETTLLSKKGKPIGVLQYLPSLWDS